jgi:tetratricopeptide (TPR) repeat protein
MVVSNSMNAPESQGQLHPAHESRAQLEQADQLRQRGELDRAEAICNALTRRYPDYLAALHTLGLIYLDKHNFELALDCLIRAQMLDPENWMTLTALSLSYMRLGAPEMAVRTLNQALAIRPNDASIFASLGEIYRSEREYELAVNAYRKALILDPELESSIIGLALSLSTVGKYEEAADILQNAMKRGHRSFALLHVVSTLPQSTVKIDLLNALDSLAPLERDPDAETKNSIAFVRATALHAAGRYAEAWQQLAAANGPLVAQHQSELKDDVARREKSLARLCDATYQLPLAVNSPVSLFILGCSRFGKSTLEQLVSSVPGVKAGYEGPIVEYALRGTYQSAALPTCPHLEDLPAELLPSFRDHYLADLTRRAGAARVFTSALSSRIHDASLIASVLPNIRFVLMRRNRNDTALRIYMSKYLRGNSYAYDLKSIAAYMDWYARMIDLMAAKFSKISVVISYEGMIADPTAAVRKVADLAGLSVNNGMKLHPVDDRDVAKPYAKLMGPHWQ